MVSQFDLTASNTQRKQVRGNFQEISLKKLIDAFLRIYWNGVTTVLVHKTEVVKSTTDPKFDPFTLHFSQIGGPNGILKIESWDFNENGSHELLGTTDMEVTMVTFEIF